MPHGLVIEEPITNYFRRIGTTRNNKRNFQPAAPTAKRKRPQTSQGEDARESESQKPRTRQKLAFYASSRNRSEASDARTRSAAKRSSSSTTSTNQTASLHASRLSPSTPLPAGKVRLPSNIDSEHEGVVFPNSEVKSSSTIRQPADGGNKSAEARHKHNQYGSLQTPPPTVIPRRKFVKHVQPAPSATTTYLPSLCSSAVTSLPTPITIPRRMFLSGSERQEGVYVSTLSSSSGPTDPHSTHSRNHISTGGRGSRGSGGSREQDHNREQDIDEDPFVDMAVSQTRVPSSQTQDLDPWPLVSLVNPPPAVPVFRLPLLPEASTSRRMSVIDYSDSDEFIHSSQTQHILPHHTSPRRKFAEKIFLECGRSLGDESIAEEIVPSSQSQTETELSMSPRDKLEIRDRQPETLSHQNNLLSASCSSPRRSLFDGLPPIPIQDPSISDDRTTDAISMAPVDSATEDESDDDEPSIRNTSGSSFLRMPLRPLSQDVNAVSNDNGMPEETAEPVSSFPNTVQDFELMFGESSGSLPGDFPMSLQ